MTGIRIRCRKVTAVVAPVNTRSQRFRLPVGFVPLPLPDGSGDGPPARAEGGLPVWKDWDGPGEDRVRFSYAL